MGQSVAVFGSARTITSKELVEQINIFRAEVEGKAELTHDGLLKVIREEFEEEISLGKISESEYTNSRGKKYPMFNLTIAQAKQVLVRESKVVRKAVIKRLDELESKQVQAPLVIDSSYMMQIALQMKEVENQRDEAIRTKGMIGDRKTASAMGTAGAAVKKVRKLEQEIHKMKTKFLNATELGKLVGESARSINSLLSAYKYHIREGSEWVPTSKGKALCTFNEHVVEHSTGNRVHYTTLWDPKILVEMNLTGTESMFEE